MKKIVFLAIVLTSVLFSSSHVYGQVSFYLGAHAGYSAQKPDLKDIEFNTNENFLYGFRAGFKFLVLGVEANYFKASHLLKLKNGASFDWAGQKIDYSFLGLNLKYILSLLVLHPYLTVGYGYYTIDIKQIAEARNRGYNVGLGAELAMGERFSFVLEGKYHHVQLGILDRSFGFSNFTASGGFNLNF